MNCIYLIAVTVLIYTPTFFLLSSSTPIVPSGVSWSVNGVQWNNYAHNEFLGTSFASCTNSPLSSTAPSDPTTQHYFSFGGLRLFDGTFNADNDFLHSNDNGVGGSSWGSTSDIQLLPTGGSISNYFYGGSAYLANGNFMIFGGRNNNADRSNDISWSPDLGNTWYGYYNTDWYQWQAQAPWIKRDGFGFVTIPNTNIVLLTGGNCDGATCNTNDVWISSDGAISGTTFSPPSWNLQNAAGPLGQTSEGVSMVALYDGPSNVNGIATIVLAAGEGGSNGGPFSNDVFVSTDYGLSWTSYLQRPFSGRYVANMIADTDNFIYLIGGVGNPSQTLRDAWISTTMGVSWTQLSVTSPLPYITNPCMGIYLSYDSTGAVNGKSIYSWGGRGAYSGTYAGIYVANLTVTTGTPSAATQINQAVSSAAISQSSSQPPAPSSSIPIQSSSLPTQSSSLPTQSSSPPIQSSSLPLPSSSIPIQSSSISPMQSSSLPTQSSSQPTLSSSLPIQSSSLPTPSSSTIPAPSSSDVNVASSSQSPPSSSVVVSSSVSPASSTTTYISSSAAVRSSSAAPFSTSPGTISSSTTQQEQSSSQQQQQPQEPSSSAQAPPSSSLQIPVSPSSSIPQTQSSSMPQIQSSSIPQTQSSSLPIALSSSQAVPPSSSALFPPPSSSSSSLPIPLSSSVSSSSFLSSVSFSAQKSSSAAPGGFVLGGSSSSVINTPITIIPGTYYYANWNSLPNTLPSYGYSNTYGGALTFDGSSSQYLDLSSSLTTSGSYSQLKTLSFGGLRQTLTIDMWVYPTAFSPNNNYFTSTWLAWFQNTNTQDCIQLLVQADGTLNFAITSGSNGLYSYTSAPWALTLNNWQRVTVTSQPTPSILPNVALHTLKVNGTTVGQNSYGRWPDSTLRNVAFFGKSPVNGQMPFSGMMTGFTVTSH